MMPTVPPDHRPARPCPFPIPRRSVAAVRSGSAVPAIDGGDQRISVKRGLFAQLAGGTRQPGTKGDEP